MKSSRLKNFCESCRKQCRDQNAYQCHINSFTHNRKLQQLKTNPEEHIQKYSNEMQYKFIQILKSKYPGESKDLQVIYEEYSQQKRFIKFNSTKWKNLTQFGQHLKQAKNIKVSGNPPDCYITYTVNKTLDFIMQNKKQQLQHLKQKQKELFQKSLSNRLQRQKAQEQREIKKFEQQMKQMQKQKQNIVLPDKLQFTFDDFGQTKKRNSLFSVQQIERQVQKHNQEENTKKLLIQQNIEAQLNKVKKQTNKKNIQEEQIQWIFPNIIVKIKVHQIDQAFHNKKCKIIRIVQPYIAQVKIGTALLEIDQTNLQTVIPKIDNKVMILYGLQKQKIGILKQINIQNGIGTIQVQNKLVQMPFNLFSKVQQ